MNEIADHSKNKFIDEVKSNITSKDNSKICVISASVESELVDFEDDEALEYLNSLGINDSGVSNLIRSSYELLNLASYFTAGEKEVRAWTFSIGMKAPQCAGVIHTDFERGFIKAEVVTYNDLIDAGCIQKAKELGKYRLEGKDYIFKDGDVALFRFNN